MAQVQPTTSHSTLVQMQQLKQGIPAQIPVAVHVTMNPSQAQVPLQLPASIVTQTPAPHSRTSMPNTSITKLTQLLPHLAEHFKSHMPSCLSPNLPGCICPGFIPRASTRAILEADRTQLITTPIKLMRELRNSNTFNWLARVEFNNPDPNSNSINAMAHLVYNTSIILDPQEPKTICQALCGPNPQLWHESMFAKLRLF